MAVAERVDPLVSVSFYVDVGDVFKGTFRSCTGLGSKSETIEYITAGLAGNTHVYKIPGVPRWTNIVLKRGVTDSMDVWDWRKQVEDGDVKGARRDGSIVMYNQRNEEVARWNFFNGWPAGISGPNMDAGSNEIAIEELEIAHEKLVREK